ncbi:thiamine ABC transporter substrate-binding protein [Arcanobacterium hippocoleae]|uniref:thiamine ABC transporter substrate-binding protein n=1 Tax=Arcanobacterium hippocoleae TaxID=149017 RepID=UPI00333FF6DF
MTHDSFALDKADIAAFEKTSGYQLKTISAGDGTVINQLRLKKDAPVVDGFYGIDNFTVSEVIKEDLAAKLETPVEPASLMVDGKLVAIDQGDVCLNVDKTWFAQKGIAAPASFDDLLKPEYKDLTVLTDPVASTPGLAFFVGTIAKYGDEGWKEYWQKLLANGAKISAGWSDAYYTDFSGAEGKGLYPIVLSYASSPAESKGATAALEGTCVEQLEYAGVVKNAKNPAGARAFIEFLLSDQVQASLPQQMYVYPVKNGVELPEDWAKYAKRAADPIKVDSQKVAKQRKAWLNDFTALYQSVGK